jgi:hypothetical protein
LAVNGVYYSEVSVKQVREIIKHYQDEAD